MVEGASAAEASVAEASAELADNLRVVGGSCVTLVNGSQPQKETQRERDAVRRRMQIPDE